MNPKQMFYNTAHSILNYHTLPISPFKVEWKLLKHMNIKFVKLTLHLRQIIREILTEFRTFFSLDIPYACLA